MSAALALGLLLQGLAVGLLVYRRWQQAKRSLGLLFVGIAVIYHGATEVLQAVAPVYSDNRLLTTDSDVAVYAILVGVALLFFAGTYRVATREAPDRASFRAGVPDFYDWRFLVVFAVAAVAVTAAGRAATTAGPDPGAESGGQYLAGGFATQFLVVGLALASFAVLVRTRGRWLVLVLTVQCTLHTLAGQRLPVAISVAVVLYLLAVTGIPVRGRQLAWVSGLILLSYLVIHGARADAGRQAFGAGAGVGERVAALGGALAQPERGISRRGVGDLGVRLDGNSYPSIILHQLRTGSPPIGPVTLRDDAMIAIPRFLAPGKLSTALESRSLKVRLSGTYGITSAFDRIPTQLGELLPIGGPVWMVLLAGLGGLLLARAEGALWRRRHPAALLGLLALVAGILQYEGGLVLYTISARGALTLGVALLLWQQAARALRTRRAATASAGRSGDAGEPSGDAGQPSGDDRPGVAGTTPGVSPSRRARPVLRIPPGIHGSAASGLLVGRVSDGREVPL
ncbi:MULTISPECIES: hypothetical protein [Frankia]|uniref:Uncharacterized protein n=1 Tax=Frankia alni (strain DSM 45986 / CECT 9034 / ACN14a) TaxID=326424 RepID=Q0RNA3_FRAAA|nr:MULTISPECIES: hypothetical protein [Frankia]CAJ60986.1 hypothetical protein; putative membrane protein [Frankia alni ACN14a]